MRFQDEINEIRAKKLSEAKSGAASKVERNRQACEPYIESICERTREEIKAAARDGKIRYQTTKRVYRYDWDGDTELLSEEETGPFYPSYWLIRCEINFAGDGFLYNDQKLLFQVNEVDTLLYLLHQVELRLSKDGIVLVDYQETERDHTFLRKRTCVDQFKRSCFSENESCMELWKIRAENQRGEGNGIYSEMISFNFAYFISDKE